MSRVIELLLGDNRLQATTTETTETLEYPMSRNKSLCHIPSNHFTYIGCMLGGSEHTALRSSSSSKDL